MEVSKNVVKLTGWLCNTWNNRERAQKCKGGWGDTGTPSAKEENRKALEKLLGWLWR